MGEIPLPAGQKYSLSEEVRLILQEMYEWKTIINKLASIISLPNERPEQERSMGDRVTALKSQFARLATMKTQFDSSTRLTKLITTLKEPDKIEPLPITVGMMKHDSQTWKQVPSLFVEEERPLEDKRSNGEFCSYNDSRYLTSSGNMQQDHIISRRLEV